VKLAIASLCFATASLVACGEARTATDVGEASTQRDPTSATQPQRERIDVHMHLVADAVDELLATLDRHAIQHAVVIASPHLDPKHPPPRDDHFAGWRDANDRLLALTAAHRDRLLPFVTVEPAELDPAELERWLAQGACGVKLYAGHRSLHERPLDAPEHAATFELLERRGVPLLLHVNTFRYEAELDALLQRHPKLEVVCAHLCGSRTDLDRLERILAKHPTLRVDTSHGPGQPGIDGFMNLERERDRMRTIIEAEPDRFLFGSDLVTMTSSDLQATRAAWDRQIAANLGLLERERFEFLRTDGPTKRAAPAEYHGLALEPDTLDAVMAGNARRWLGRCLPQLE
jgi:predicted TIM-barrel fold metal-dependent hydrolase